MEEKELEVKEPEEPEPKRARMDEFARAFNFNERVFERLSFSAESVLRARALDDRLQDPSRDAQHIELYNTIERLNNRRGALISELAIVTCELQEAKRRFSDM